MGPPTEVVCLDFAREFVLNQLTAAFVIILLGMVETRTSYGCRRVFGLGDGWLGIPAASLRRARLNCANRAKTRAVTGLLLTRGQAFPGVDFVFMDSGRWISYAINPGEAANVGRCSNSNFKQRMSNNLKARKLQLIDLETSSL